MGRLIQLQMDKIIDIQLKQSETNRRTAENITCKFKYGDDRFSSWDKLYHGTYQVKPVQLSFGK